SFNPGGIFNSANFGTFSTCHVGGTILNNQVNVGGNRSITSDGYNLVSDSGGGDFTSAGDQINTNPQLDPMGLQDNGGLTPTVALVYGSPAIDQGVSFGLTTDQRGVARPFEDPNIPNASGGDGSDIGAYEAQGCRTSTFAENFDG